MAALERDHADSTDLCGNSTTSRVDALVDRARTAISSVDAQHAARLWSDGALLVDIRPAQQRRQFGRIRGAVAVERTVLEWRLEPEGAHRHPLVVGHRGPFVVFCQDGYASSLAVRPSSTSV